MCAALMPAITLLSFVFFNDTATTEIYTLSLHDALPIYRFRRPQALSRALGRPWPRGCSSRSEEHTSELQSPCNLVCRLLLEKKFYRLGVRNEAKGIIHNVHTPQFNIDETAIETGIGMMAWLGASVKFFFKDPEPT